MYNLNLLPIIYHMNETLLLIVMKYKLFYVGIDIYIFHFLFFNNAYKNLYL